ncbi:AMP-binding protein, partial [Streptomyces sp. NPDC057757]|uniref:AMP-binding protein n=1 Tax=Streptomyces sp. NPDC057757 TaxID=3346241 RepID=UPI0036B5AECA
FQTMLTLDSDEDLPADFAGLACREHVLDQHLAKFDLSFAFVEQHDAQGAANGLTGAVEYAADLFDHATVATLAERLARVLRAAAADPDAPIGTIEILDPAEREDLLTGRHGPVAQLPAGSVPELFEAQAAATPEAIALVAGSTELTYAELNARANGLALRLAEAGVRAETPVALLLERSPALAVALLAVLKAGGSYVPLDDAQPQERLAAVLADAGARIAVTDRDHPALAGLTTLTVGEETAENLELAIVDDRLAYVMHTSGSTGTPKGVQITHQAVLRLTHNTRIADTTPDDVFLHLNSIAFDASSYEIWTPLTTGATLAIAAPGRTTTETATHDIHTHRPTVLLLTTALFNALMDNAPQAFATARHVLVGGEALSPTHVNAFQGLHPDKSLVNVYGPSESATITSTAPVSYT